MDLEELTDFANWIGVRLSLAPWTAAYDEKRTLLLIRSERTVHVSDLRGAWRARHRRQLHRMGFRSRRSPQGDLVWEWRVPDEEVMSAITTQIDIGANSMSVVPVVMRLRKIMITDRLVLDRAVEVLRD